MIGVGVSLKFLGKTVGAGPGNLAPVITSSPVTNATDGVAYSYQVQATDPEGGSLSYSLPTKPSGMTISGSGLVQWNPSSAGSEAVIVRVTDDKSKFTDQAYTITVAVNLAPVITSSPVTTGTQTVAYQYQVQANDPEGGSLIYSLPTNPTGMTISGSGLIQWTPSSAGSESVVVRVTDNKGLFAEQPYSIAVAAVLSLDIMAAGGGGAGGTTYAGGGAGGAVSSFDGETVQYDNNYTVTIGAGGANSIGTANGGTGGDSSIAGTGIGTLYGRGGKGGAYQNGNVNGYVGGGAGGEFFGVSFTGGTGSIGGDGGDGQGGANYIAAGGGGGGSSGDGGNATTIRGGNGGEGTNWKSLNFGTYNQFGHGGGGSQGTFVSNNNIDTNPSEGVTSSLGSGAVNKDGSFLASATAGPAGGHGGGGGTNNTSGGDDVGGSGGAGAVIIRYVTSELDGSATGGTVSTAGGYTYHYFTSSGTFALSS